MKRSTLLLNWEGGAAHNARTHDPAIIEISPSCGTQDTLRFKPLISHDGQHIRDRCWRCLKLGPSIYTCTFVSYSIFSLEEFDW